MKKKRKETAAKKKTAQPALKKNIVRKVVVDDTPLTAAEIEHFKQFLLEKRREILNSVQEMEDEALKKSRLDASGDLSSMPIHMADLGTDNFQQEFSLGLLDSERTLLREIDDALIRIEEGTYGICQGSGKQIPRARLEAQPWARYGVEYAEMMEKGLVPKEE